MTYLYSNRLIQIGTRLQRTLTSDSEAGQSGWWTSGSLTADKMDHGPTDRLASSPKNIDVTVIRRSQSPDLWRSNGNNYFGITIGLSFYEKLFVSFKVRLLSVILKDGKERIS